MRDVENALQQLELAQRELMGGNPSDFDNLERLGRNRGLAIDAVLELVENPGLTAEQLDRLKRVHLGGILSVERIRAERQAVREELSRLSQQGRVLSGYQSGSTSGSTTQS
jgi:hypothetical protein